VADSQHSRGVSALRGGIGEQMSAGGLCWGGCLRFLSPRGKPVIMIEPSWKEARGVAISSPLDILLVGATGACKSQPLQFFGVGVGGGARQGDVMRNWR